MTRIEHPVELQTVAGHADVIQTALMDAGVTAIVGTLPLRRERRRRASRSSPMERRGSPCPLGMVSHPRRERGREP